MHPPRVFYLFPVLPGLLNFLIILISQSYTYLD
uniref:Uncharacterized protein n=1 Tax=Arundo donax TaxID=35708 RepID=A0A0A9F2E5_ARUDO